MDARARHFDRSSWKERRIIADRRGAAPGPLLVVVAGLHGNEPAGGEALQRVLPELETAIPLQRGRLLAVSGNLPALAVGKRFIDEDLNRAFIDRRIDRLRQEPAAARSVEERQMLEMVELIDAAMREHDEAYLLDLHSTSGPGLPFGFALNADRDPALVSAFAIPLLVGVELQMQGTILHWFARRGHSAIGVEGGQHDDEATIEAHEAVIRIALDAVGLRGFDADPKLEAARALLDERAHGLPRFLEFTARHEIAPDSDFRMLPGFRNFDFVTAGTPLATDRQGEIRAPEDAFLLFPLYQSQGDDGFFLARPL